MEFYINKNTIYAHDKSTNLDFVFDSKKNKWQILPYCLNLISQEMGCKISLQEASTIVNIKELEDLIKLIKNI